MNSVIGFTYQNEYHWLFTGSSIIVFFSDELNAFFSSSTTLTISQERRSTRKVCIVIRLFTNSLTQMEDHVFFSLSLSLPLDKFLSNLYISTMISTLYFDSLRYFILFHNIPSYYNFYFRYLFRSNDIDLNK